MIYFSFRFLLCNAIICIVLGSLLGLKNLLQRQLWNIKRGEKNAERYYHWTILSGGIQNTQTGSTDENYWGDTVFGILLFVSKFCGIFGGNRFFGGSDCLQPCSRQVYYQRIKADFISAYFYGILPCFFQN